MGRASRLKATAMDNDVIDVPPAETVTDTELELINELITDAKTAQALVDRVANRLAVKYKLKHTDSLDWTTGVITRG